MPGGPRRPQGRPMDEKGATSLCESPALPASAEPAAGPPVPLYLIVLSGSLPGAMLRLTPGVNRVGRSPENAVQLLDDTVSRRHALLRADADGALWLTD